MHDPRLESALGSFELINPIICGSGEHVMTPGGIRAALASGVAGVVAKSINESLPARRQLRSAQYAQLDIHGSNVSWAAPAGPDVLARSIFCRSGLVDCDEDEWFAMLATLDREASASSQFVAASIVLGNPEAAAQMAGNASRAGLRVLEFNIGAPHGRESTSGAITIETDPLRVRRAVAGVRAQFPGPLWVKLTGLSENVIALVRAAREAGADAVGLTGRFMGLMPDLETLRPLLGTAGAYGGQWAVPITCRWLSLARREIGRATPLLGTNGAREGLDVARFLLAGASAVEMTSVVYLRGFAALSEARDQLLAWLETKDLTVRGIIGATADAVEEYSEQPAQAQLWREIVPPESR